MRRRNKKLGRSDIVRTSMQSFTATFIKFDTYFGDRRHFFDKPKNVIILQDIESMDKRIRPGKVMTNAGESLRGMALDPYDRIAFRAQVFNATDDDTAFHLNDFDLINIRSVSVIGGDEAKKCEYAEQEQKKKEEYDKHLEDGLIFKKRLWVKYDFQEDWVVRGKNLVEGETRTVRLKNGDTCQVIVGPLIDPDNDSEFVIYETSLDVKDGWQYADYTRIDAKKK